MDKMIRKLNKFVGFMTIVCMILSGIPTFVIAADAGTIFTVGDYTYTVNTDTSTVTLTEIGAGKLTGEVVVPGTVSYGETTYTVTQLANAFKNQGAKTAEITSIMLPDTITKFTGTATFYNCVGLTSIHLPVNLTGDATASQLSKTFYGCTNLTSVELPAGITKCWGTFASGSGVRTVKITGTAAVDFYGGSGTTEARAWDNGITGITIYYPANGTAPSRAGTSFTATVETYENGESGGGEPDEEKPEESPYTYSVLSEEEKTIVITGGISGKVLSGEVTIPSEIDGYTVVALGDAAFGRGLFKNVTSVTIPDTVKRIENNNCFYDCKNIETINLPDEMEYIGVGAFTGCTSLTSIVIPEGVTKLSKTFRRCTSLTTVTIPTTVTEIDAAIFATTDAGTDILPGVTIKCAIGSYADQYAKSRGIPVKYSDGPLYTYTENGDGTISITDFADDAEIAGTLEIPQIYDGKTVTGIGANAFSGRTDIKSITLPATINAIGTEAFAYCDNLSVFEVPNGVTSLDKTFLGCTSLSVVTISATVTSISDETFYTDLKDNGGEPISRLVIYCQENSAAENYAKEHSIDFEAEIVVPEAWDGSVDTSWYDVNEVEYFISTPEQLAGLRKLVNDGTELFYGKTVTLTDNINMDSTVWKVGIGYYTGSTDDERSFNGVFNGDGHIIYNFTYNSNADSDTETDVYVPNLESHKNHGLFGQLGRYGKIENLALVNTKITAGSTSEKVVINVGAFVGINEGEINHCYINGLELAGGYWGAWCDHNYGGVSGSNSGTIKDFFIKDIDFRAIEAQLHSTRKGGITAGNSGTIQDCYVYNPIFDTGDGYYQWDADGNGTNKCPIMFYYDPISSTNSGTISNVYSSNAFTRDGWTVGVHPYDSFGEMSEKMILSMDKLTFRTISPADVQIEVERADGDMAGIEPQIYLKLTQPSSITNINNETVILKQEETIVNSINIIDSDDAQYPLMYTIEFAQDLAWDTEYELSVSGVMDIWNREITAKKMLFKTTNEIVYQEFALYENYGTAEERILTSLTNVSAPVTAVIKGLKNNGDNSYNAVFSIGVTSNGQILKGAAKLVNIASNETKTSPVIVGNIDISAITAADIDIQAVLYKAFGNVVPLIKSVQASR